jgi:hypothetical protein
VWWTLTNHIAQVIPTGGLSDPPIYKM